MKQTYFYAKEKHVKNSFLKLLAAKNNVIVMDLSDLKTSLQKMAEVLNVEKILSSFPKDTNTNRRDW